MKRDEIELLRIVVRKERQSWWWITMVLVRNLSQLEGYLLDLLLCPLLFRLVCAFEGKGEWGYLLKLASVIVDVLVLLGALFPDFGSFCYRTHVGSLDISLFRDRHGWRG
jgi:hypothetical protein